MNEDLLRVLAGTEGGGGFGGSGAGLISGGGNAGFAGSGLPGGGGNAQNTGVYEDAIANIISFGLLSEEQGAEIRKMIGNSAGPKENEGGGFGASVGGVSGGGAGASEKSVSGGGGDSGGVRAREAFLKEHAGLLKSQAGALLEEYLKEADDEDFEKVGKILAAAAQNAVEGYLKKEDSRRGAGREILASNEEAKKKLKTYSSQGSRAKHEAKKSYTREEIGRMSADEFARVHDRVMEDFARGRIL